MIVLEGADFVQPTTARFIHAFLDRSEKSGFFVSENHGFEEVEALASVELTIRHEGAWQPLCNNASHLVADAHEHFAHILVSLAKLSKGSITLATGL